MFDQKDGRSIFDRPLKPVDLGFQDGLQSQGKPDEMPYQGRMSWLPIRSQMTWRLPGVC